MRCKADCRPDRGERMLWRLSTTTCFKVYCSCELCPRRFNEHKRDMTSKSFFMDDDIICDKSTKKCATQMTLFRTLKLTQNSSFVQYDKNLLQSNSHSRNCEIPIDGYFGMVDSPYVIYDDFHLHNKKAAVFILPSTFLRPPQPPSPRQKHFHRFESVWRPPKAVPWLHLG